MQQTGALPTFGGSEGGQRCDGHLPRAAYPIFVGVVDRALVMIDE
jgi:hypothetical protein